MKKKANYPLIDFVMIRFLKVRFVMSDKTGTLTRNIMKFKRCSIAGINFGNDETDDFEDRNLTELLKNSDVGLISPFFLVFANININVRLCLVILLSACLFSVDRLTDLNLI